MITSVLPEMRAAGFVGIMGVNTHISWQNADSAWANGAVVESALAYLGIGRVRDSVPYAGWTLTFFQKLAAQGITFDFLPSSDVSTTGTFLGDLSRIADLEKSNPGSVYTIEGPNEINQSNLTYLGQSTATNLSIGKDVQKLLYSESHNDPVLRSIPVLNLTVGGLTKEQAAVLGNMSPIADSGNWHSYFSNGDQPRANLAYGISAAKTLAPDDPVTITESGYYTAVNDMSWGGGGVTEPVQAKLTLNLLLDAAKMGVKTLYLYELLDNKVDLAAATTIEDSFGLFHGDGTPKAAATAIHNLVAITGDVATNAGTFAVKPISYEISGLPGTGSSLLTQKASGTYQLVVWAEPDIWDEQAKSAITVPSSPVTVTLGQMAGVVKVYDPLAGAAPVSIIYNANQVTFPVSDHPVIVEIDAAPPAVPAPIPAAVTAQVTVNVTGCPAGGVNAHFNLLIDGRKVGDAYATTTAKDFTFSASLAADQAHKVQVQYDNDTTIKGQDRNLTVNKVTINGHAVAATDANVTYDKGALDGKDVVKGLADLWWNGTLVINADRSHFMAAKALAMDVSLASAPDFHPHIDHHQPMLDTTASSSDGGTLLGWEGLAT